MLGVIELVDVSRRFGDLTAVDHVSLAVDAGEIVGLLGHNGAGKTTIIRVINGLLPPDTGHVRVLGRDPLTDGEVVRRHTGVLTEYPALDEYLTVRENLAIYARINGLDAATAGTRIDDLLARLSLADKGDVSARGLSAGLKQRVALARALVHDPQVLLLDEPTTNLDPVAARDVRDLVVEAARDRGHTVLLSTHNLAEAELLCDRVAIMRHGRLLAVGNPAALRRQLGDVTGARVVTDAGRTAPLVAAVNGHGSRVHAQVLDDATVEVTGDVEVPRLVEALVAAHVPIHRVDPLEPTLEDLYVRLHDGQALPPPPPPAAAQVTAAVTTSSPPPPPPPSVPDDNRSTEVPR